MTLKNNLDRGMQRVKLAVRRIQGKRFLHFLHIGKTAGTAIKYVLTRYPLDSCYFLQLHKHRTTLKNVPGGDGVIFFLRDPLSRFISGFYSRQREGRPRIYSPWRPAEREAFERFRTPDELGRAISSGDEDTKASALKAMQNIRHVRDFYSRWFISEHYFLSRLSDIFFFGFQESLSTDFAVLRAKLGLPETATLPEGDVAAHRNPKDLDRKLSSEAEENLRRWYAQDYRFIDLCHSIRDRVLAGQPINPPAARP